MRRERTRGKTSVIARAATVAALVLPLALAATACDDPGAARQTPPPVRIGAIYNLTGDQSPLDGPSLDGARLAVDRINARGGLLGRRVELLERDGQTNQADVRRAAASLVASGCSAIIGLSDTDQVLAAAPIAARAAVPFVTSGATSPLLTRQVPDWLFLACFGDNAQAAASAQYATEQLGARTAAILFDRDLDYTRLLARYFGRSFRAQGGNVLVTADYAAVKEAVRRLNDGSRGAPEPKQSPGSEGQTESGDDASGRSSGSEGSAAAGESSAPAESPAAGEASASGDSSDAATSSESSGASGEDASGSAAGTPLALQADVVFVAAGPEDAARMVRRLRAAAYRQPVMGGDSFDSEGLVAAAEETGGKVYYTTHAGVGMSSASRAIRRFDASFHAAYGRAPQNAFAALGYDAVGLVASAIRRADSVKPAEVRDALQVTRHFPGVTGTLSYDGDDRVPQKKVTVVCVGRRPVVVAQFTPGYVSAP